MNRYDELTGIQMDLLENGVIDLVGDVDFRMFRYVREALMRSLAKSIYPPLKIIITSEGGSVEAGLSIYDALKSYPAPTIGIINSCANSMASIILQACDIRRCLEHAKILIHNPHIIKLKWGEKENSRKLKERFDRLDNDRERMLRIWSECSGQSRKKIATICAKDKSLTAEEALKLNLIDEITNEL